MYLKDLKVKNNIPLHQPIIHLYRKLIKREKFVHLTLCDKHAMHKATRSLQGTPPPPQQPGKAGNGQPQKSKKKQKRKKKRHAMPESVQAEKSMKSMKGKT